MLSPIPRGGAAPYSVAGKERNAEQIASASKFRRSPYRIAPALT